MNKAVSAVSGMEFINATTTQEIMSEVESFTIDEKLAMLSLVRIMADYPGLPDECISRIVEESRRIISRFEGESKTTLYACLRDCHLAIVFDLERSAGL